MSRVMYVIGYLYSINYLQKTSDHKYVNYHSHMPIVVVDIILGDEENATVFICQR